MRVWDIPPDKLCRNHLLGEHREIHAIWSILTKSKKGYSRHPETLRWIGKLKALYARHEKLAREMCKRGYEHRSCLDQSLARGKGKQERFINSAGEQIKILSNKKCGCRV
ncbi:MAG: pyrimidine dimer DNA glycosylase [Candidatus Aenigmarchaeota archaeon]|nr:pyrimidine dimer DNA glycosylase [Candidatus Aenigmarchaeota archaeon]NIQ18004.1 pyrimidine dimer DNA glycosylase [Candidatus Aenigmarchaeota archaeon]